MFGCASQAFAQTSIDRQVIGSAGQLLHSASGASLLFTTGETAIQELTTHCSLAQGFHQVLVEKSTLLSAHQTPTQAVRIQVYPNPVSDLLNIQTDTPIQATLYDLQGKVVVNATNIEQTETIRLQSLSPGAYVLRTQLANGTPASTFRIQIVH